IGGNRINWKSGGVRIRSHDSRCTQGLLSRGGYRAGYGILHASNLAEAFVSKKEEGPVLNDGTTNTATEIVLPKLCLRKLSGVKGIPRVEHVVLKILVQGTVKAVASAFGDDTDQATWRSPTLGGVVIGLYVHFLNGIDRGLDPNSPDDTLVVVRAVNLCVVELNILPVHRK